MNEQPHPSDFLPKGIEVAPDGDYVNCVECHRREKALSNSKGLRVVLPKAWTTAMARGSKRIILCPACTESEARRPKP